MNSYNTDKSPFLPSFRDTHLAKTCLECPIQAMKEQKIISDFDLTQVCGDCPITKEKERTKENRAMDMYYKKALNIVCTHCPAQEVFTDFIEAERYCFSCPFGLIRKIINLK